MGSVALEGFGSGGAALNFKIVPGLDQPSDPKENTIWVRTEEKITSWAISPNAPEAPQEGMVWIPISDSGSVSLRILKKELVEVYPLPAKQYVGGEFARKDTIIFQDGVWLSLIPPGALYWDGDECVETTNGWRLDTGRKNDSTPYVSGDGSLNTYTISLTIDKKWESIQAATKQKISLAGFSKLCCEHSGATAFLQYGSSITMDDGVGRARLPESDTPTISVLDISAETGSFYVAVQKFTSGTSFGTTTIHKVWME